MEKFMNIISVGAQMFISFKKILLNKGAVTFEEFNSGRHKVMRLKNILLNKGVWP